MSVSCDFVGDHLSAHTRHWGFVGTVNVGNHDAVCLIECFTEFFAQQFRSGIAMRLKHGEHTFAANRLRRFQRRLDFGRMMPVIIYEQKAWTVVLDLKSAPRMLKLRQRLRNFLEWNAELGGERDHAERV